MTVRNFQNAVAVTLTGTGTGNLTIVEKDGYFLPAVGYKNEFHILQGAEKEVSYCEVVDVGGVLQLSRTTCRQSSNNDAFVNFPAGDKVATTGLSAELLTDIVAAVDALPETVITTLAASGITTTTATLEADLESFGLISQMRAQFDYRETGDNVWVRTSPQTITAAGTVTQLVESLTGETAHEYRAVAKDAVNPTIEFLGDTVGFTSGDLYGIYTDVEIDALVTSGYIPVATAAEFDAIRTTASATFGTGTTWEAAYTGGLDKNYVLLFPITLDPLTWAGALGTVAAPLTGTVDLAGNAISGVDYIDALGYAYNIVNVPDADNVLAPTNFAITSAGGDFIASWTAAANALHYRLYQSFNSGAWTVVADNIAASPYQWTPAEVGTYNFAVVAVFASGLLGISEKTEGALFDDVSIEEGMALIELYEATDGDNWTTNTNWLTDSTVNNWHGVTVVGGHVTALSLPSNNLVGDISAFTFMELPSLALIDFTGNASLVDTSVYDATLSDLRVSAVDGTAFIDNAAAITGYADGTHDIKIYDAAGRLLRGVLGSVGSGEVLSAELLTGWVNGPGSRTPFNTLTTDGKEITSVVSDGNDTKRAISNQLFTARGPLIKAVANTTITSGGGANFSFVLACDETAGVIFGSAPRIDDLSGAQEAYNTHAVSGRDDIYGYAALFSIATAVDASIADISVKQVTAPSTSGAVIVNAESGTVENFLAKNASFVYNAASYRVQIKKIGA